MAGGLEQTIRDWTIRRKILTGFAMVLACTALLGWLGLRALDRMNVAAVQIVQGALPSSAGDQRFFSRPYLVLPAAPCTISIATRRVLSLPALAHARRAGTIASRNGSATEAPMPRSRVRREKCLFVMNIAWTS